MGLGILFIAAGVFALKQNEVDPNWTKVSGKVIDSSSRIDDGTTMYSPIVEYKVDGQLYEVTSRISSSIHPNVGEERDVAYNPTSPNDAKIAEALSAMWFLYIFPLVGAGLILMGLISFLNLRKRSKIIDSAMPMDVGAASPTPPNDPTSPSPSI
ncbi:MAG: DUF3592 domain-containing protein [Candidatus Saccharimonas sp.]